MKVTIHVKTEAQLLILSQAMRTIMELDLDNSKTTQPPAEPEDIPAPAKREVRTKLACQTARSKILSILRSRRRGLTPKQVQEIMGYKSSSLARHDLLALVKENQVRVDTKTNGKGTQEVRYFAIG